MNNSAVYITEKDAKHAARYIRGPQVSRVQVLYIPDSGYIPVVVWKDNRTSVMKTWQAEWFSLYKEN